MSTLVVGLTGGIASGKSTVASMLAEAGAVVVDADALVHAILAAGSPVLSEVVDTFGDRILTADGSLDRSALADQVFGDPSARKRLELIVHPRVAAEAARLLAEAVAAGVEVVVYDAALLVETGAHRYVDVVVSVEAPHDVRLSRLKAREDMDAGDAESRMAAQLGDAERAAAAHHVIVNDAGLQDLQSRVKILWEKLMKVRAGTARQG